MKIFLATDHAGFEHKEALKKHLIDNGHEVTDCGAEKLIPEDDYVPHIAMAARSISADPNQMAVIFGASGQGEAIAANRFPGVRAAVYYGGPKDIIELSRKHNNANVLSIGARFISIDEMINSVDFWLSVKFSDEERHSRRNKEIDSLNW